MQANILPVMEHFLSLQGEGRWTGHAAYFIRLAGCDVECPWCDVKESWTVDENQMMSVSELVSLVQKSKAPIAIITGGEPTLHDLYSLTQELKKGGIRTHIETSGTNKLTGRWDWVTFSPKRYKKPYKAYFLEAHELKVIISHSNDLRWALELGEKLNPFSYKYIQPEWSVREEVEPLCVEFIKEHPAWSLSLQTHKYLGID